MELAEFRKDFIEQVSAWASADGNFLHSAFMEYAAHLLQESEEVVDFQPCYYRGAGSRNRALAVDGYAFDDADGSLRLFLAEPTGLAASEAPTLTQTDAKSLFARIEGFITDALSGRLARELEESAPAHALAASLQERKASITRLRFYLVTDAQLSSRVRDWPEQAVQGIPTEFHIWDITRFHRVAESRTGRDELIVDFTELAPDGIPCLEASLDAEQYQGYLCVIPAPLLGEIYDRFGSRLLEGNVRSFLSAKGKVNKGIRNTIISEPHMFFAYNNGIAATCSGAEISQTRKGLRLLKASDLQIVNGGQTTASLAATRRRDGADLSHIFVQMKLSVVSPETSGQIIPLISRYANSQNRVSDADFFSNHEFHRRIEEISRRLWAPAKDGAQHETHWFYERARGQFQNEYASLTPASRNRYLTSNPRDQVITKTDLAKFENAWRQLPHVVSLGAQKNFVAFAENISKEWDRDSSRLNEEYFRRAVARAILFRQTERVVSAQPWYQGGYRANIVAYAVSKLAHMIEVESRGHSLDFRSIWQRQGISKALEGQIAKISHAVFEVIVNPEAGLQNVTEWCKKEICWTRVKSATVGLSAEFRTELAHTDDDQLQRRDGRNLQEVDAGIQSQAMVVGIGAAFWSQLRSWAAAKRLLTAEEDRLIRVGASMPRMIPTAKQSLDLLRLKERLEGEGFRGAA